MRHFRKIWDTEKHAFLMEHREMPINECYQLFLQTFPDAKDVTPQAFRNQRSRIGAISEVYKTVKKNHLARTPKPLFSEHEKKGYIVIKIEQPNKWMFKHHYVYWQTTGHKPEPKKETVIFLDGNNRNFAPENLFLLPRNCIAIMNNPGTKLGVIPGNPELTKINATNAILMHKIMGQAQKLGLVSEASGRLKSDINEYYRKHRQNMTPEQKELAKQKRKAKYQELKNNPEKYKEYRKKKNEYAKQWAKRKKHVQ